MQDYANLYFKRFRVSPKQKLEIIRCVLASGVSQTLMLAAIIMIVGKKQ